LWLIRSWTQIPGCTPRLIGTASIAYRQYLWDLGLGVAEAINTAQRGMGLDWPIALELIKRSVAAAKRRSNTSVFCGAGGTISIRTKRGASTM
jgi:hypothetical protein